MVKFRYDNQPSLNSNSSKDTTSFSGPNEPTTQSIETPNFRSSPKKHSDNGSDRDHSVTDSYEVGFKESIKAIFSWTEAGAKVSLVAQILYRSATIPSGRQECIQPVI